MPESTSDSHGSVATAEPPAQPPAPPSTGAAAPEPGPKRGGGCWLVALAIVGLVALALALFLWWALTRSPAPSVEPVTTSSAFESAMTRAMVKAPGEPPQPVDLSTVEARGTHSFEATFTGDELTALVNAFPHKVVVGNAQVELSNVKIAPTPEGGLSLKGTVTSGDASYSGTVSGEVAFVNSRVVANGPIAVEAEGFPVPDAQAQEASQIVLAYVNGYLAAAPGLLITAASVSPAGVHVVGLAPDSISY
jgi:hypothetical protein